mmetsp:Transcript_31975/g.96654  ORF Transcript_31975/g.96654 Transcript_31975/m.96654 type:complete len:247 (-) Transcript_31975:2-742(-)
MTANATKCPCFWQHNAAPSPPMHSSISASTSAFVAGCSTALSCNWHSTSLPCAVLAAAWACPRISAATKLAASPPRSSMALSSTRLAYGEQAASSTAPRRHARRAWASAGLSKSRASSTTPQPCSSKLKARTEAHNSPSAAAEPAPPARIAASIDDGLATPRGEDSPEHTASGESSKGELQSKSALSGASRHSVKARLRFVCGATSSSSTTQMKVFFTTKPTHMLASRRERATTMAPADPTGLTGA